MKNIKILAVVLAIFIIVEGVTSFRQQAQNRSQQDQDDPPTPIQLGVMSEKQRKHSRLYRQPRGTKSLVSKGRDVSFVYNLPWGAEHPIPVSFFQLLDEKKCKSEVGIIGVVLSKTSQLTENNDFVFTDYEIGIQDILKNRQTYPLTLNTNVTVTRRGGAVSLGNRTIRIKDRIFKPLRVGRQYLLFLKTVPDTDSFTSVDSRSSFELRNGEAIPLTDEGLNYAPNYNLGDIINQLRGSPNCQTAGGI